MGRRSLGSTSRLINTTWPLTPYQSPNTADCDHRCLVLAGAHRKENWREEQRCSKKKKSNITTTESATAFNVKDLEDLYQEFYRAVSYLLTFGSQDTHWAKVLGLPSQLKMATRTKNPTHHKMVDAGHAYYWRFDHMKRSKVGWCSTCIRMFKVIFHPFLHKYKCNHSLFTKLTQINLYS